MAAYFSWSGQSAPIRSFVYHCSVGISPGVGEFVVVPADNTGPPALAGDAVFGDVTGLLVIPDCHIDDNGFQETITGEGRFWNVRFLDRRWRWSQGPSAAGHFNQKDDHGKLIPWSVRSPFQLARYLFSKMGEVYRPRTIIGLLPGGAFDPQDGYLVYVESVGPFASSALTASQPTMQAVLESIAAQINASPDLVGRVTASVQAGGTLVIEGSTVGVDIFAYGLTVSSQGAGSSPAFGTIRHDGPFPSIDLPPGLAYPGAVRIDVTGDYDPAATYTIVINDVSFALFAGIFSAISGLLAAFAALITASTDAAVAGVLTARMVGSSLALEGVDATRQVVVRTSVANMQTGGTWQAHAVVSEVGPGDTVLDTASDYLQVGVNYRRSYTNPATLWSDDLTCAQALARLADTYGRVIVYDVIGNRASIQVIGSGTGLPDGPVRSTSPSIDPDMVPSAVRIVGSPTRFQFRLRCRPVGEDWDTSQRPLPELSYAPNRESQRMRVYVTGTQAAQQSNVTYNLLIEGVGFQVPASGITIAEVLAAFATAINDSLDPAVDGVVTATVSGDRLEIVADSSRTEFEVIASADNLPSGQRWDVVCDRGPVPANEPTVKSVTVTFRGERFDDRNTFAVTINGVRFTVVASGNATTFSEVVTQMVDKVNESVHQSVKDHVTAEVGTSGSGSGGTFVTMTVRTTVEGERLEATIGGTVVVSGSVSKWEVTGTEIERSSQGRGFEKTAFPTLQGQPVRPTERLNYKQALSLAQKSVYRFYQVAAVSPFDDSPGIPVPSLSDRVTNRYLIVPLGSRPDQIVPRPGDERRDDALTLQPVAVEFYNGYSQDRAPAVYGSIWGPLFMRGTISRAEDWVYGNTPKRSQFYLPFGVSDPLRQVYAFQEPAFRQVGDTYQPAEVVIEDGAYVLDPTTYLPLRYETTVPVPGGLGPVRTIVRPDVQQEIIGQYSSRHELTGYNTLDTDAEERASYYAQAAINTYQIAAALTNEYIGLLPIILSGQVRQVSWSMSEQGFYTIASANTEHSTIIVPYPDRRLRENLPTDSTLAAQNIASDPFRVAARNAAEWVGRQVKRFFG